MRIDRRGLLRGLGVAAASSVLPALAERAFEPAESSASLVRLHRNESAYGPGEKARAAFQETLARVNRYPGEEAENLRAAIASAQGVQPNNITLGCGSTEVLQMAAEACLGPGKTLVMASPAFNFIAGSARSLGARVRSIPLTHNYAHDLDAMLGEADATAGLIYICNPNNPTGTLTAKSDLDAFLRKIPAGVFVLMDEAYHDYVPPAGSYSTYVPQAASHPRLIVTRTFSKMYGLAGLRVGYAASSPETAQRLATHRVESNLSIVAARVALVALSDRNYVGKIAELTSNDRQEFFNQANARMLRLLDSQTNFVLMRTEKPGTEVAEVLRAKGVLVAAGYPHFENYIRVSLGLREEMQAFWRAWDSSMPHHPM